MYCTKRPILARFTTNSSFESSSLFTGLDNTGYIRFSEFRIFKDVQSKRMDLFTNFCNTLAHQNAVGGLVCIGTDS